MKILLSLLAAALVAGLPVHAIVLELKPTTTLVSDNVTLNDVVASTQGVSAEDLAATLASAPSLGESKTWTRDDVARALPSDLKAQDVEWQGAPQCVLSRPATQFNEHDVRQVVTAELAKNLPADSDFAILETPDLQPFAVPQGELETRVELAPGALRHEWADAILQFRYQGQLAVTKAVRFHWAYTRLVWQATNSVKNGEELTTASFQQVEMNVLKLPGVLAPATDFPDGKVAAHGLAQGRILMENDWVEPVLVARNDLVTILYDHHGVSITVQARALASGTRNEVIAVQNVTSKKIFNARVVDQRSLVYDE
jgi:flagella basal body P-ring formation protein FlgA